MGILIFLVAVTIGAWLAFSRPRYLVPLLLVCGPLRIASPALQGEIGLDFSALWVLCAMGFASVALLRSGLRGRLTLFERAYLVFLAWCLLSIAWSGQTYYALRVMAKLMAPFLFMMLARRAVRSPDSVRRAFRWLMVVTAICVVWTGGLTNLVAQPVARLGRLVFTAYAPLGLYCAMTGIAALAWWKLTGKARYLVLFALVAVTPVCYGTRTSMLALAVGVSAFVLLHYKVRAVPALLAIYLAGAAALFVVPWNRDYMFVRPQRVDVQEVIVNPARLDVDNLNTSGRSTMWPVVLEALWEPSPLVGSGLGATQSLFYSGKMGLVGQVHSGYVQLLCDVGLVGLVLYLFAILTAMAYAWRVWKETRRGVVGIEKTCASVVLCAMPAFLVCVGLDNSLDYVTTVAQYPFMFVGMTAGCAAAAASRSRGDRAFAASRSRSSRLEMGRPVTFGAGRRR